MDESFRQLLATCPVYEQTRALDDLRARDFTRLDVNGQVYLDEAGAEPPPSRYRGASR